MEERADAADARMDKIEDAAALDRAMIAELHAAGVVANEHAKQLEQALRTSRTIGAAIGVLMKSRNVDQDKAFAILRDASSHQNRKIRDRAAEIVDRRSFPDASKMSASLEVDEEDA
jgi:AmiR/NasT family two-component response regulator